jgi:hypothetical protein
MATDTPAEWAIIEAAAVEDAGIEAARDEARKAWAHGAAGIVVRRADLERLLAGQAGTDHLLLVIQPEWALMLPSNS